MTMLPSPVPSLKECALKSAAKSGHYKRQRSLMETLPGHLVDDLFVEVAKIRRRLVGVEIRGFHHVNDDHIMHLSRLVNQLEILRLRDCTVGCATLQKYIALCSNLRDLDLSGTNVSATQTFSPIANLNRLKNLHTLQLEGLQLYDMHFLPLEKLPNITHLNIASNFISNEGAVSLTNLQKLEILDISRTSVTIVPPLSRLRVLKMNSCNVGMVNEVDGKDGLVSKNLEALEFNYAEFTEHLGWCFVAELMRDSSYSLRHVDFSDSTLSEFSFLQEGTKLRLIDLSGTFVTDADLLELSMLTNLTELRLKNTSITNQGVENLWPLGNHLQSLSLRDCRHIDSWVFPSLANIKSLTFLNLGGTNVDRVQFSPKRNRLSPIGWKVDVQLPKLISLGLMGTQWTDEGSEQLQHICPYLTELRMGSKSERVTDESLKKLQLSCLAKLVFEVPKLTDSGLKKIYWLKKSLRVVELFVREGLSAHALQWLYTEIGLQKVTRNGHVVRRDPRS